MQSCKIEGLDEIQDMLKEYRDGGALELKKYREIGAIEECKRAMEDYRRKRADKTSESGRKEIKKREGRMKWYIWKIKRAFKGLFRNKNTPLCDMCEYSGCLKCKIAKFTRCAHLFKADCYIPKSE